MNLLFRWGFLYTARMISIGEQHRGRRAFLRVGGLGMGGLALPGPLGAVQPLLEGLVPLTGKSVILLFMHGGPPQHETFDPKMDGPDSIRSATGEIRTSLPGVTYGATLEHLAKLAHKTAVVRSFTPGDGSHNIKPVVGKDSMNANLGSIYARVAGVMNPETGIPVNTLLFPRAVVPDSQAGNNKFGKFAATGGLGSQYAPFAPDGQGPLQADLTLNIDRRRLDDRRHLLAQLDRFKRRVENNPAIQGADRIQQQGFDTLVRGITAAFDLNREDPRLVERYDTGKLMSASQISRKWNNHKNYVDHVNSLGKLLLLARRLCENGSRFVTVTTNFVWDFHADKNNATLEEGMRYVGRPFDRAVSAYIEDVEARGMQDDILLVCCGEMGRSPKINKKGGRDHWGGLAPLLLHGGGLRMGQVLGQSDAEGGQPTEDPVTIADLNATIMHTLLDLNQVRLMPDLPASLQQWFGRAQPVQQLVG